VMLGNGREMYVGVRRSPWESSGEDPQLKDMTFVKEKVFSQATLLSLPYILRSLLN